jgi:hypothetical protein
MSGLIKSGHFFQYSIQWRYRIIIPSNNGWNIEAFHLNKGRASSENYGINGCHKKYPGWFDS